MPLCLIQHLDKKDGLQCFVCEAVYFVDAGRYKEGDMFKCPMCKKDRRIVGMGPSETGKPIVE